ncbi:glutathione S-transferase [Thalassotalea sp. HSM 43]|uniref:MAPEG family protein n=1 Tax=Thalassotalea sp. HSM 43 TaxID=2552945 RepID=UPI0010800122|nr:MAPEG family protein [Thalassotalea sp. HSM 43]QBY03079.1 glutathione S-transferase [Thalassotalea sp. HSM 43]
MQTASLAITGFYTGILAILYIALSFKVIGQRRNKRVGIGDGGGEHPELAKAIRVHANFIEYVPIALLLLAIYELGGGNVMFVHAFGGLLVTARFFHAIGLGKSIGTSWQRFVGTLSTFITILVLSILNIIAIF